MHPLILRNLSPSSYREVNQLDWLPSAEAIQPFFATLNEDTALLGNLKNLTQIIQNSTKGTLSYLSTALLLNKLSLHISTQRADGRSVAFLLNPNNPLPGDFLNTRAQPDMISRLFTSDELEGYIEQLMNARQAKPKRIPKLGTLRPAWGETLAPLELKTREYRKDKICNYLDINKIYRVDLSYILGFAGRQSGFDLFTLSPSIMQRSKGSYPWNDFVTLLRYIVGLYKCYETRDPNIEFLPIASQAWMCKIDDRNHLVFPFIATHGPGRSTWVATGFDLEDNTSVIVKVSWVDMTVPEDEGKMYTLLGELPGLMHLRKFWKATNVDTVKGGVIERRKCYLVTDSIGLPLSKCRSVSEFLSVMDQLCQVIDEMHNRGVFHRDISWYNVMLDKTGTISSSILSAGTAVSSTATASGLSTQEKARDESKESMEFISDLHAGKS
ncbi:hypothetical protein FRC17_009606 [Serendipita sp. 399]|nr:hypothetical protein FRC17_009606 [Serendipita sp. 399]